MALGWNTVRFIVYSTVYKEFNQLSVNEKEKLENKTNEKLNVFKGVSKIRKASFIATEMFEAWEEHLTKNVEYEQVKEAVFKEYKNIMIRKGVSENWINKKLASQKQINMSKEKPILQIGDDKYECDIKKIKHSEGTLVLENEDLGEVEIPINEEIEQQLSELELLNNGTMEKGTKVWYDNIPGLTAGGNEVGGEFEIEEVDTKYDEDTGEPYKVVKANGQWFRPNEDETEAYPIESPRAYMLTKKS